MEQIAKQEAREIQEQNQRWLQENKETSLQDGELFEASSDNESYK